MTVTAKGSVMAAFPGANNMVGKVEQVRTVNDTEQLGGGSGAALGPYPHEDNPSKGGSWPGPVNQPEQNLGNV